MSIQIRHWFVAPYALCLLTAFCFWGAYVFFKAGRLGMVRRQTGYSLLLNLGCVLYGGKLGAVLTAAANGKALSFAQAGVTGLGGAAGLLLGTVIFARIVPEKRDQSFELYAVSLGLLYGLSKFGCLFAGCCRGIAYGGPGKIRYMDAGKPVTDWLFPIQAVEALSFLALFMVLDRRMAHSKAPAPTLTVGAYAVLKFLLDYLRGYAHRPWVTVNQVGCLILLSACIFLGCCARSNGQDERFDI